MEEFEIVFYDHPNGSEPAKDFILSLDTKMRAKMLRTINCYRIMDMNFESHIPSISMKESLS